MVNKESVGIDNNLTKDRNVNTFKTYCKRRKSGARFPDRKANNRLCACHCIAGNDSSTADSEIDSCSSCNVVDFSHEYSPVSGDGADGSCCTRRHRTRCRGQSSATTHSCKRVPSCARYRSANCEARPRHSVAGSVE